MTSPDSLPAEGDPRTSHQLRLPQGTDPASVLTMVRNVHPEASADAEGVIVLGEDLRLAPDRSEGAGGGWTVDALRDREDPLPEEMGDSHGYGRAFPDGMPFGAERRGLDLAWSLARRFHGIVITDGGARLAPHPLHLRDLRVVSPHQLAPESLAELLAPLEPEAELDQVPEDAPRSGCSLTISLPEGEEISLRVGASSRPTALRALPWLEDAVDYELVHLTADPEEDAVESPDAQTAARWQLADRRIGLIAGLLTETVGGYVVDLEGFLVDPSDLL